jgi:outer membrane protein
MIPSSGLVKGLTVCGLATSLLLFSCGGEKKPAAGTQAGPATSSSEAASTSSSAKIAYVNLDSLGAKYEYFKNKKADFDKRTAAIEVEIERLARNLQNEYNTLQGKAKAGTLTQAEGEAAERKLGAMQQDLETRRQNLGNQLMKDQDAFNEELQKRMDQYMEKFNADKGYDFILSYTKGGGILYANPAKDITNEVVDFMNAEDAAGKTEAKK